MNLSTVDVMADATTDGEFPAPASGEWTFDDLLRLPDDGRRYEIIDGKLHVSPAPSFEHQLRAGWLRRALEKRIPSGLAVVENVTLRLRSPTPERILIPDLLVADRSVRRPTARGGGTPFLLPAEIVLAIEIVSPSSRRTDRVTKPRLYADAGITWHWRVERTRAGATVHIHRLADGRYEEITRIGSGESAGLDEPWPVFVSPR
jgi:Uma2 family endonuclease